MPLALCAFFNKLAQLNSLVREGKSSYVAESRFWITKFLTLTLTVL
jgi:hypothetical protein